MKPSSLVNFDIFTRLKHICPYCSVENNAASNAKGSKPVPNDLTFCIACGELSIFKDDLTLRKPTEEEKESFRTNSEIAPQLNAVMKQVEYIRSRRRDLN